MTAPAPTLAPLTPAESELLRDPDAWEVFQALPGQDDDHRPFVRAIAADVALPVSQVRLILNHMGALRLAKYGQVLSLQTGQPIGSSWWLTRRGTDLRRWFAENAA